MISQWNDHTPDTRRQHPEISEGLVEQAAVQARSTDSNKAEVEREYLNLNTGACATDMEPCGTSPYPSDGNGQGRIRQAGKEYTATARRWATALRDHHAKNLIDQARNFALRHPGLIFGGAVAAGFELARIAKVTGAHRSFWRSPGDLSSDSLQRRQDFLPGEENVFHS